MKHFSALVLILTWSVVVSAQTAKRKPTRIKPIRVTVTVKTGLPPTKPLPNEEDEGIWNAFELKIDGAQVLLPATPDDIMDDVVGDVRSFQAVTKKAHYLIAVRKLEVSLDPGKAEEILDRLVETSFVNQDTKIIERRNLSFEGRPGRELISEENSKRSISRIYLLDGKLFALSITVPISQYEPTFEKWVNKFFESFRVSLRPVNSA